MEMPRKFFGKHEWKPGGRLFGMGTSPEADWKIIFISAIVLTVLVIGVSVYIYIKIDKGEIFVVDRSVVSGGKTLDTEVLRETVSYYQNKALEFDKLTTGATTTESVDPSL